MYIYTLHSMMYTVEVSFTTVLVWSGLAVRVALRVVDCWKYPLYSLIKLIFFVEFQTTT